MSLLQSLYTGTTGLIANGQELSVIGDNLANANTIGFKVGRAAFEDALSQSLVGSGQIGLGTRLQAVQRILTQGSLLSTGNTTDLAIEGAGFFVVKGNHAGQTGQFYTRAGQFSVDRDGFLVSLEGLRVQGYTANTQGVLLGQLGDLKVSDLSAPPTPTANLTLKGNLQSDAALVGPFDPLNPTTTSNFSSSTTVVDSLGASHPVDLYYTRNGTGTWEWHAMTDGANVQGGIAGTPSEIASGTLTFDAEGRLVDQTQSSYFNPVDAVAPQQLTFDFGSTVAAGGTGLDGFTQFANPSSLTFLGQDGYGAGDLANIAIDSKGRITGAFTNGTTRTIGQVAVADFAAPDQLKRVGGNLLGFVGVDSGPATIGAPGEGGRGGIASGSLEQSNVDMAAEFVRMIAAQRSFQANSKTITTADQLLSELIQLKR